MVAAASILSVLFLILAHSVCTNGFATTSSSSSLLYHHQSTTSTTGTTRKRQGILHNRGELHDGFKLFDALPSLYQEQERLLVDRGVVEFDLMETTGSPMSPSVSKGTTAAKGFGTSTGMKPAEIKAAAKIHAKELRKAGVVRIDDILTATMADELREYVFDLRRRSEEQVKDGTVRPIERFADVLLKENRCDLTIPLEDDIVIDALLQVLQKTPVGKMMSSMLGKQSALYELSCLISDKGSNRQVVHPDTPCTSDDEAVLYTCFIALQDIDPTMGPTTWLPNTHTLSAHELFQDDYVSPSTGESQKDKLLRTTPSVLGVLPKGSCAIFDSRLLHCGGANTSDRSRALFYFSFKNSKIGYPGNPGSIRPELGSKYTITTLEKDLKAMKKKR
jgi:ectoine hydroxylase-related dioxygenase (phytanoyl-CoA dioxygenase family)